MFEIGDKIVYPMHGAGIIESIEEKKIFGERKKYYTMLMSIGNMKAMIPVESAEEIGVRVIITIEELDEVVKTLSDEKEKMAQNWNRRYRDNMEKIKSGDVLQVSSVVRDLMLRDLEKGLSTGERKMLNDAKQILVSEIALVKELSEAEAEEFVIELIK